MWVTECTGRVIARQPSLKSVWLEKEIAVEDRWQKA
jgi:hypothetical protein